MKNESSTKMKTIGLLGGTSWPSTIYYYKRLNELVYERLRQNHSARIILSSIDYNGIKTRYDSAWEEIPNLLALELDALVDCKPECIVLCNMSLHQALDEVLERQTLSMPLFHAVHETAVRSQDLGIKRALLLGTKRTMEVGYFPSIFSKRGIELLTPTEEERAEIQRIQTRLAQGEMRQEFEEYFSSLLSKYGSLDAVVLGCTELPLVIKETLTNLQIVNPLRIQCEAAVNFAISDLLPST